jgi:transcriptional regulator with GAF, ATPase, and Fis domain
MSSAVSDYELPTELQHTPGQPKDDLDLAFSLEVIDGVDRGTRVVIRPSDPSRLLIGSSTVCALKLTDRQASRRHAAVEFVGARLRITDLGSTNGTIVQGLSIVEAFLDGGEVVRIGQTALRVERSTTSDVRPVATTMRFGRLIGGSLEMRRIYPLCERLAASDVPLVVEGETGTGKEQLAEAIHECGSRAQGPFIVFDCTCVTSTLAESALFGHERGAFTGAVSARRGVFELADGGTLLIDEIGDLELPVQAKLLRAIERKEIQRVGSDRWQRVNVRVIAATRRNLDQEVQAGRFRDDLFYRLAIARIELPPLRKRAGDIGLLARHFWRANGGEGAPSEPFLKALESYDWPGNVRELQNAIVRRLSLGNLDAADVQELDFRASALPTDDALPEPSRLEADAIEEILERDLPFPRARDEVLALFETRFVERVLARYGSVSRAAAASGIALRYFQRIRARQAKPKD